MTTQPASDAHLDVDRYIRLLWQCGKVDTQWIADRVKVPEYEVYNTLAKWREERRNRGQING
jgi:hypothetical protein